MNCSYQRAVVFISEVYEINVISNILSLYDFKKIDLGHLVVQLAE